MKEFNELWKGDWVSVVSPKDAPYEMLHEPDIALILPIVDNKLGIRKEVCPPYLMKDESNEELYYTVISGKIEEDEEYTQTAIRELKEEAGVSLKDVKIYTIYKDLPVCKSTDMRASCVVITGGEPKWNKPQGDGTEYEKESSTIWVTSAELIEIISQKKNIDALLFSAFFYVMPFMMSENNVTHTISSIGSGFYQFDKNDVPLEEAQVSSLITDHFSFDPKKAASALRQLKEVGTLRISETSKRTANKGTIVDIYEVEYPAPANPMKETEELASHLDEQEDFIVQNLYPGISSEDIAVDILQHDHPKDTKPNHTSGRKCSWREYMNWKD